MSDTPEKMTRLEQFIEILSGSLPIEETDLTPEEFDAMRREVRQQAQQVQSDIESGRSPIPIDKNAIIAQIISELN